MMRLKWLQDWIKLVSIAAENRGYPEGAKYMAKLAKNAGFQQAPVVQTEGSRACLRRSMRNGELDAFDEFLHVIVITDTHEANCSRLGAKNKAELQANATFEVVRS